MQRSPSKAILRSAFHSLKNRIRPPVHRPQPCDVFINHRSIDTKRGLSGLLYQHLRNNLNLNPFLDSKNMKPGDRLFERINSAIHESKIGITVFSPTYCQSYFCLHELTLIMETKKRVIPIFCDVKPSELRVTTTHDKNYGCFSSIEEIQKFNLALQEAKHTVGLTFDSSNGDWSEFLRHASDAVIKNLIEVEEEEMRSKRRAEATKTHTTLLKSLK